MRKPNPIATLCGDLHLSLTQPSCRADKDWMKTQADYLQQLKELAGGLPILCAGDIFDRWNAPPELINFALQALPDGMICIPGQHDLPNHQLAGIYRSGYGVLLEAKKIRDLSGGHMTGNMGGFLVTGFGWDEEIFPPDTIPTKLLRVALIHRYCWMKGTTYPGAPEDANVSAYKKVLKGYDVAHTGDNHHPFTAVLGKCNLINCGTFIRRKTDEIPLRPSVGILYSDGSVELKPLDTSGDKFHEVPEGRDDVSLDMRDFIDRLEGLGEHGLDFRKAVINHLKFEDIDPETKGIVLEALEGCRDNKS